MSPRRPPSPSRSSNSGSRRPGQFLSRRGMVVPSAKVSATNDEAIRNDDVDKNSEALGYQNIDDQNTDKKKSINVSTPNAESKKDPEGNASNLAMPPVSRVEAKLSDLVAEVENGTYANGKNREELVAEGTNIHKISTAPSASFSTHPNTSNFSQKSANTSINDEEKNTHGNVRTSRIVADRRRSKRVTGRIRRAAAAVKANALEETKTSAQGMKLVEPDNPTFGFGMRVLVIGIVVILALIMIFGNLGHYSSQQEQLRSALATRDSLAAENESMKQELAKWKDPNYVKAMAHERLGYVMPGEKLYMVEDPETITGEKNLQLEKERKRAQALADLTPWYVGIWNTLEATGNSAIDPQKIAELENLPAIPGFPAIPILNPSSKPSPNPDSVSNPESNPSAPPSTPVLP